MLKTFAAIFILLNMGACSVKEQKITIQFTPPPVGAESAEPYLFTDKTGTVFLSWIEKHDTLSYLYYASLKGDVWSTPMLIDSGANWFVNWADYPVMTGDGKQFMTNILQKSNEKTYSYDVKLLASLDGSTWTSPGLLHHDSVQAEHGFVSLVPFGDGVFASWLDGRNTGGGEHDHEGHHGAMTLRAATAGYDGKIIEEWELDNRVCDCCQTTAAITDNGPVVIYRDRSDEEIRDMSIVRLTNGAWTKPKPIYADQWKINGCPVNGPRCEALGNTLAVAWFSSANDQSEVKVIFSEDGGETFSQVIRIDEGNTIGRVDLVLLNKQHAMVSWMEGADIKVAIVTSEGKKETLQIVNSSEGRSSGFPQLTKNGDRVIIAWTDDQTKRIQTALIALPPSVLQ